MGYGILGEPGRLLNPNATESRKTMRASVCVTGSPPSCLSSADHSCMTKVVSGHSERKSQAGNRPKRREQVDKQLERESVSKTAMRVQSTVLCHIHTYAVHIPT